MADKLPGGLADKSNYKDYSEEELAKGIKVELEHTDDIEVAKEIAMDHLEECSDYYTRLDKLEQKCKKEKKAMKLAQVIKNHLEGKQTDQSREVFAKISGKLQERGFKAPFKVAKVEYGKENKE